MQLDSYHSDGGTMVGDPVNNQVYYCGGNYFNGAEYCMAVSKTTNAGITWQRSFPNPTTGFCYALAVDRASTNIIYAGGIPGVFKSTDAGATWSNSSTGLSGDINALAINPLSTSTVYAGSTAGVFKSTDAGTSWTNTGISGVRAIAIYPDAPDTIFAATNTGVYRSNTGGGNWTSINTGLGSTNTASLGFNPDTFLFCGTKGAGIYRLDLSMGIEANDRGIALDRIRIYPNPFRNDLRIRSLAPGQTSEIRIYDAAGRIVKTIARDGASVLNATWHGDDQEGRNLPPGVYFIKINGSLDYSTRKVLKIN